jgi:hypothetical protein
MDLGVNSMPLEITNFWSFITSNTNIAAIQTCEVEATLAPLLMQHSEILCDNRSSKNVKLLLTVVFP